MEIVFCGSRHEFIDVVELGFGPEFPDFLMKFLDFQAVIFNGLVELFLKVLDHSFLFPQLLVFVIDDSLKGFDGLLCGLSDTAVFLLVIIFDLFLTVEEPSGVVFELTAGELGLHDE